MPLPTINDTQIAEPVLTNLLVGYMQSDMRFVATKVFPTVTVDKDSGQYFIVTGKYWFTDELEVRAPGTSFAKLGYGLTSDSYTTKQYAVEHLIPDETRANSQVPMDLEQIGLRLLAQKSLIRKEIAFASAAMAASVWGTTNSSATKWSNYGTSDPVGDIRTARRTISTNTGQNANVMVCGEIVEDRLANHPDLLDRLKYVKVAEDAAIRGALAAIFGLERLEVSYAVKNTANEGQSATMAAIIDDDALICYSPTTAEMMTPCAGKTLVWNGGGGAGAVMPYRRDDLDSDALKHKEQWVMKVVATDVGYLFTDVTD